MIFQASDFKRKHFLNLLDDKIQPIKSLYIKGDLWIKYFGHSNSLCVRASRAITYHALIEEYHLYFFPREDFSCLYSNYPIETRHHIFHDYRRFNNYWNPRRDTISYFVTFLKSNPSTFSFREGIT